MAEIIANEKGFKVIKVSMVDCAHMGGMGICDWCNDGILSDGYFVAVLDSVMCRKCYEDWCSRAEYYEEDSDFEARNFNHMKKVLRISDDE